MGDLAYWPAAKPLSKKNTFAKNRDFIKNLDHIDQIWEKLKFKCGDTLAVCDLRGKYKEKFSYSELADLITKVSFSFENYGLKKGDVVTVISENSPRWLAVDQGLMRLGAINAVRGINSPSVELDYIIGHSNSVGLIVQSKEIWLKLNNKEELKKRLKFIINLEDEQFESLISWSKLISSVEKENSQNNNLDKFNLEIDDVATILYTSGTTGKPKGVPLTHANFLHQIINLANINNDSLIVVDELYEKFNGDSLLESIDFEKNKNILIIQSLSKTAGLAGLRIGFTFGNKSLIQYINKVTGPYDVNSFAITAALAALKDKSYIDNYVLEVKKAREWILNKFKSTKIRTHFSGGNFFLIWPKKDPKILIQQTREKGILIRSMENKKDIGNSIRVSIGTKEQMIFFWENYKILDLKN